MKKSILVFSLLLASLTIFSQVKIDGEVKKGKQIGEIRKGGSFVASLTQLAEDSTLYLLMFNNMEYKTMDDLKSIGFKASTSDLLNLYNHLASCFEKDKGYESTITLGDSKVMLSVQKMLGVKSLYFYGLNPFSAKGYFMMTRKELDKLFSTISGVQQGKQ